MEQVTYSPECVACSDSHPIAAVAEQVAPYTLRYVSSSPPGMGRDPPSFHTSTPGYLDTSIPRYSLLDMPRLSGDVSM